MVTEDHRQESLSSQARWCRCQATADSPHSRREQLVFAQRTHSRVPTLPAPAPPASVTLTLKSR